MSYGRARALTIFSCGSNYGIDTLVKTNLKWTYTLDTQYFCARDYLKIDLLIYKIHASNKVGALKYFLFGDLNYGIDTLAKTNQECAHACAHTHNYVHTYIS